MSTEDIYSFIKIKKVLNSVYKSLESNKNPLSKAIRIDEEDGNSFELESLKIIVKKYLDYKEVITEEDIKSQRVNGMGNVAVVYDGRPEIAIEMAIKCLLTNNNVTFFPNLDIATTNCILKIFEESMKEIGYNCTVIKCIDDTEELYDNQDDYDLAVVIGDKYEYYKFKQRFLKDVVYCGFGSIGVYCDNDYFEDEVNKIREFIFNNNYVLNYYDEEDINEAIQGINDVTVTDRFAIYTKDSKKALQLIKNIKAHKIFVNTYPLDNYTFEFDETKLLLKKQIITG